MELKDCMTIEEISTWLKLNEPYDEQNEDALNRAYELGRAQLAERDAQLAAADRLLQRTTNATAHVARHDNLRRDIRAYWRTRQPTQDKGANDEHRTINTCH